MKIYRVVLTVDVWAEDDDEAIEAASMVIDGVIVVSAEIDSVREEN